MSKRFNLTWDDEETPKKKGKSKGTKAKTKAETKPAHKYANIIGIDLGTTNCVVSKIDETGDIKVIPNDLGDKITPSFIVDKGNDEYLVGSRAKDEIKNGAEVLYSFKPYMGSDLVLKERDGIKFTAQFCQSILLDYLASYAKKDLGLKPEDKLAAIITVPAYFDEHKKYDTKLAAERVGLEVIRILEEPSASAFNYMRQNKLRSAGKVVAVYDLGGGTFDVSLVFLYSDSATVVNIGGDSHLGGDNYDTAIKEAIYLKYPEIREIVDKDKEDGGTLESRMKIIAETMKIDVSNKYIKGETIDNLESTIKLADYQLDDILGLEEISLEYKDMEATTRELTQETIDIFDNVVSEYGLTIEDLDNIVMTGGSSNLPFVKEGLKEFVSLNVADSKKLKSLTDDILNSLVDLDLSVGMGAGIYAKLIADGDDERLITDIVTHDLGIATDTGEMEVLIHKGDELIRRQIAMKTFIPDRDNAENLHINVYEGDDNIAEQNTLVRKIIIPIPPNTKREDFRCDISFTLNKSKVLTVSVQTPGNVYREKVRIETENETINPKEAYDNMVTFGE